MTRYGLVVAVAVGMIFFIMGLFVMVLRWVVVHIKELMAESRAREHQLLLIIDGHKAALDRHTDMSREFQSEIKKANDFQRSEHERLIDMADRILERVGR